MFDNKSEVLPSHQLVFNGDYEINQDNPNAQQDEKAFIVDSQTNARSKQYASYIGTGASINGIFENNSAENANFADEGDNNFNLKSGHKKFEYQRTNTMGNTITIQPVKDSTDTNQGNLLFISHFHINNKCFTDETGRK